MARYRSSGLHLFTTHSRSDYPCAWLGFSAQQCCSARRLTALGTGRTCLIFSHHFSGVPDNHPTLSCIEHPESKNAVMIIRLNQNFRHISEILSTRHSRFGRTAQPPCAVETGLSCACLPIDGLSSGVTYLLAGTRCLMTGNARSYFLSGSLNRERGTDWHRGVMILSNPCNFSCAIVNVLPVRTSV